MDDFSDEYRKALEEHPGYDTVLEDGLEDDYTPSVNDQGSLEGVPDDGFYSFPGEKEIADTAYLAWISEGVVNSDDIAEASWEMDEIDHLSPVAAHKSLIVLDEHGLVDFRVDEVIGYDVAGEDELHLEGSKETVLSDPLEAFRQIGNIQVEYGE